MHLGAVVIEAGGRVADHEAEIFQLEGIMAEEVWFQSPERSLGALSASAHFAEADDAHIGFHLDDGTHEPPPMCAVGMTQRRLQRNGDGGRANIGDPGSLHGRLQCRLSGAKAGARAETVPLLLRLPQHAQDFVAGTEWMVVGLA